MTQCDAVWCGVKRGVNVAEDKARIRRHTASFSEPFSLVHPVCARVRARVCIRVYVRAFHARAALTCTEGLIFVRAQTHTYIHTHTHTCTHRGAGSSWNRWDKIARFAAEKVIKFAQFECSGQGIT